MLTTGKQFTVTAEPLDARALENAVAHPAAGALATFVGIVRDNTDGEPATHLEYEAYAPLAESEMAKIAEEAEQRWPGVRIAGAHRTGRLEVGEASVVIAVSAAHRADAIEACRYCIDELKDRVPVWKKEFRPDGSYWVEGPNHVAADPAK
jgi:molybdopterin synthase catalytic subunit